MKLFNIVLLSFIHLTVMSQTEEIALEKLEGKWYINRSNFPMWLKGDKSNPTFNYKVITKKGVKVLYDEVIYQKNGRSKSIKGFDKPKGNNQFVWRGKGFLSLLKSRWSIEYYDHESSWAIIKFTKTLFTPEGYDVISKEKQLAPGIIRKTEQKLSELDKATNLSDILQK